MELSAAAVEERAAWGIGAEHGPADDASAGLGGKRVARAHGPANRGRTHLAAHGLRAKGAARRKAGDAAPPTITLVILPPSGF